MWDTPALVCGANLEVFGSTTKVYHEFNMEPFRTVVKKWIRPVPKTCLILFASVFQQKFAVYEMA